MIEFETMGGCTITAFLSTVLYVRKQRSTPASYFVVLANDTRDGGDWPVDQANYEKVRAAIRGFDDGDANATA
jgi:hypothetical protein